MAAKKFKPDHAATAIRECRLNFLRAAVDDPHIKFGDSLREAVFIPCKRLWTESGLPVPNKPYSEYSAAQMNAARAFTDEKSRLVRKWAADHNLDYEWVHRAAIDELSYEKFLTPTFAEIPGYLAPEFIWTSWFFGHEGESTYRKRIKASFQKALDAYIREVKLERGRFLSHRNAQAEHYRWSAEYVCLGWGWSRIASENPVYVTWQAVRKAVLPILERTGIPPRHNPHSTPKGTS